MIVTALMSILTNALATPLHQPTAAAALDRRQMETDDEGNCPAPVDFMKPMAGRLEFVAQHLLDLLAHGHAPLGPGRGDVFTSADHHSLLDAVTGARRQTLLYPSRQRSQLPRDSGFLPIRAAADIICPVWR